ncbi:acetoacetyl-CoA synthetase [Roridomyces roridus]|uniref:Acetoacetyl-CoA synthetase n=1 Tax=Roridomyces roridus TaxID=1738132 RepID=A0AAD7CED3_9AGAR|nr:acetoacetyl-CoA synthetase [Roridomyces roridus]
MSTTYFEDSPPLWVPTNPRWTPSENLRRLINYKHGLNLKDYHDLHKYSVEDYAFWLDLWEYLGIISSVPPKTITAEGYIPEVPLWFPEARLNYAENMLARRDDAICITAGGENGVVIDYSYRQLRDMVRQMSRAMRNYGVTKGDRVAAIVNNTVTAVVICLATASIGGIFSSTATDMGTQGVLDRYRQIKPKLVFAETEVAYAGKHINLLPKITEVFRDLRNFGLQQAITLPSLISGKEIVVPDSILLSKFLAKDDGRELIFEQLPFNQPLFILYSSGTSGPPKCIVHSAGGVLLQGKKEMRLHMAMEADDTYFQFTTTGWMMWTFMLTGLAAGVRVVLYDGSPFYPDIRKYLKFIGDQRVTMLGTSPRFLAEVQGKGIKPLELASFEALKTMCVTGAVLTSPMFRWTQQAFGEKVQLASTSGGTDICTGFVSGCSSLPVYAGEIQAKSLGMKVEVWDPSGNNIEHTGTAGELVCTRPHPSLPVKFWGDDSGAKFRDAYYSTYPGIWRQGDFMVINPKTKGLMILGRSDGVLNPSGVRFGSGEIYSVLEEFTSVIEDSLCVGQRRAQDKDERVLLFLKMREGRKLDDKLVREIKDAIRKALSTRHVPAFVLQVEDIPYTVNGKRIEIAVKQIVSGSNLKPSGTVANPESLKLYYKYRDLGTPEPVASVKAKL